MNSFMKRTALATTLCAALLAPVAIGSTATAAPASAAQEAAQQQFAADVVQSFVAGERVTVSGTAAPGSDVHLMYMPGGPSTTVANASGSWTVTSAGVADERFTVLATDGKGTERVTMLPTHEAGEDVPISVDPIRFTPGERLSLSGTAAPNTELVISGIPADSSQGAAIGLTGARVGADGRFRAGGIKVPADVDAFDVTFHLGAQKVTVTALSTEADDAPATEVPVEFTSPTDGGSAAAGIITFTGTGTPGAEVRVHGTNAAKGDVATATVEQDGSWRATAVLSLAKGDYKLWAKQSVNDQDETATDITFAVK